MRTKVAIQRDTLRAAVLQVRSGRAISRASLATALGIAPSTIGQYVDRLIADGYLDESGLEQGPVGRPKRRLATRPAASWFAGVEFNAERVQAVRADFSGRLVASQVRTLPEGADVRTVLQAVQSAVTALAKTGRGSLLAIGAGAPGVVDPQTGVSSHYALLSAWHDVPVAAFLREQFAVPVALEHNLRAVALAERWFGGGRDLDDYVVLGPRSGFGVAIVHEGKLVSGAHHAAGEIGRWPWPSTGSGRELENALSAPAIWRRLNGVTARAKLPEDLPRALGALSAVEGTAWDGMIADYARVIGFLQLLIDTKVFFLHGPLVALGDRFCRAIEEAMRASTPALAASPLRIVRSALGDDAGALGAASLAMEAWIPAIGE